MKRTDGKHILIAGGGIGGLTAAIALARCGHSVSVFEQAVALTEVGAGLSFSQAAQSVYREIGLEPAISAIASTTRDMAFLHYKTGDLLAGSYDRSDGSASSDAPLAALQVHRADLQTVLADALDRVAPGALHLAHRLTSIHPSAAGVTVQFANGSQAQGDILIGADGLKSQVRQILHGDGEPRFTGQMAYRFLVARDKAAPFMNFGRAAVFQGEARVFNRYSIRKGEIVNCVALMQAPSWLDEGWSIPATREELLAAYADWHPDVTGLMQEAGALLKWGIFDRAPLARWSQGPVTLLGDAAHPMLPFLGLGAAMAIEDAMILTRALSAEVEIDRAFALYEGARRPRTAIVQEKSRAQGELVQSADPDSFRSASPPSHDPAFYAYDPVTAAM